jgi:hypothetical protein
LKKSVDESMEKIKEASENIDKNLKEVEKITGIKSPETKEDIALEKQEKIEPKTKNKENKEDILIELRMIKDWYDRIAYKGISGEAVRITRESTILPQDIKDKLLKAADEDNSSKFKAILETAIDKYSK